MAIDIVTGAAVGAVAGELLKAILDAMDKAVGFEYYLERLEATLESIISQAEELQRLNDELSRPRSEIGRLLQRLEEGKELVCKCSNIPCWAYYNKFLYTKKILKLDDYLHRFFNMDLRVAEARDVKMTLKEVLALRCHFKSFSKRRRANRKQSNTPSSSSTKKKKKSKKKHKQKQKVAFKVGPHEFSYRELMVATDSFSTNNIVGEGGFGKIYVGRLADGQVVAVKRFIIINMKTQYRVSEYETEYETELETLSRLHHKHLVRLVGFCDELEDEKLLVCEYMEHGNLSDHLHSKSKETKMGKHNSLLNSWQMRIKIAVDAAKGIQYLQKYALPPMIHRDIKSTNILLDASWTAKLSSFGLSVRLNELDEQIVGTAGYIDPEYLKPSTVSAKSDVFSLGVVLLELLTGRRALHMGQEFPLLTDYAVPVIMAGNFRELLDSRVMELQEPNEEDAVELLARTAMRCVASKRRKRPNITEVVADLEKALAFLQVPRRDGSISGSEAGDSFDEIAMRRQKSSASSPRTEFSFSSLAAATCNFSLENKIGSGIFGVMYRGILANGREVAVERGKAGAKIEVIEQDVSASKEGWELSVIQHVQLGRDLGYCEEAGERFSVYKYMRNGTLYDQLHNVEKQSGLLNSWNTRIRIPLDVAREIKDLHIHCDIRSSNILLDSDWTPSVSQYGLANMAQTTRNDVYGFGVLLLELLTGKPALREDDSEVKPVSVVNYAQPAILAGDLGKVLDGRVGMPKWREAQALELIAKTAVQCLNLKAAERPSLTKIITDLERALDLFDISGSTSISASFCDEMYDETVLRRQGSTGTSLLIEPADGARFSFLELSTATGGFSAKSQIGSGSFGNVYKGILADGKEVAVKRNHGGNKMKRVESIVFGAELTFLPIQHKNLVRLFGFCQEQDEKLLVYEYMRNGSLYDHLHSMRTESSPLDSWRRRIKISLDAARGIEYLHNYAVSPIVHRDIKSSNILLDASWNARVSDFGISFMASGGDDFRHMKAAGTVGYIDPEYYRQNTITTKSDVYSFGVVLLEILTGKRAIFKDGSGNGESPVCLVDYAVPAIAVGELGKVLDEKVGKPELNEGEAVELVAYTAMHCVALEGKERPNMTDVVANLDRAFAICYDDSHGSISSVGEITVVSQ